MKIDILPPIIIHTFKTIIMKEFSDCGFPLLYLFVNTYSGESKWLPFSEGIQLCEENSYWEYDKTQKPISIY